ncbi:hypothetical protein AgCh_004123 [Apium graveolens]
MQVKTASKIAASPGFRACIDVIVSTVELRTCKSYLMIVSGLCMKHPQTLTSPNSSIDVHAAAPSVVFLCLQKLVINDHKLSEYKSIKCHLIIIVKVAHPAGI